MGFVQGTAHRPTTHHRLTGAGGLVVRASFRVALMLTGACQFGHGVGGFAINFIHSNRFASHATSSFRTHGQSHHAKRHAGAVDGQIRRARYKRSAPAPEAGGRIATWQRPARLAESADVTAMRQALSAAMVS